LELAARIGQKLLADSQTLRSHNEYLEEQLLQATDKVVAVPAVMVMQYSWYLLVILVPKVLATYQHGISDSFGTANFFAQT